MIDGVALPSKKADEPSKNRAAVNHVQPHKIDYTRSNQLFTAISKFERRHPHQHPLQKLEWEERKHAGLETLRESKRHKELLRVHVAAVRTELLGLAKSYSMYYSHLRLQGFLATGYKPSLRMAWYSRHCNHVQMKEDFREDARKVIEDWLQEKILSLKYQH